MKLGEFAGRGLYGVKVSAQDGQQHELPSPRELVPPEGDGKEYRLEDVDTTFTLELSEQDGQRLLWLLMHRYWLWRNYRQTLN